MPFVVPLPNRADDRTTTSHVRQRRTAGDPGRGVAALSASYSDIDSDIIGGVEGQA
jgi:hypothetical protein